MITIHPVGLAKLIDNHEPLDLIDVRTEKEFGDFHIDGARSVPLKNLSAPKVLQGRKLAGTEPLYIICGGRVRAGLAAGILSGGGCCRAVVVDGGMELWISQGLPVVRKKRLWNFPRANSKAVHFDADNAEMSLVVNKAMVEIRDKTKVHYPANFEERICGMLAMSHIKIEAVAQMRTPANEKPSSEIVCLVDDDPMVLRSTGFLLASDGFAVRPFNKGEDFIAYVASHDVPLVVLDIWMEEMTGLEVLARLCAISPQTHVI